MIWRRDGFLVSTAVLENDTRLLNRIEQISAENPSPRPETPERDALLARLTAAAATGSRTPTTINPLSGAVH